MIDPTRDTNPAGRNSYWTIITPQIAQTIIDTQVFANQRRVRPDHVNYLARLMESGDFEGSEIKFAMLPDGRRVLINGQHRLHAIIVSGREQTILVTTIPAEDEARIAKLYAAEDRPYVRSVADTIAALNLPDLLGIGHGMIQRSAGAFALIGSGFDVYRYGRHRITDANRPRLIQAFAPELKQWEEIVGLPTSGYGSIGRLNNAGVLAVGLVTLHWQPKLAVEFWAAVRADDGLAKTSAERSMVDYVTVRMSPKSHSAYTSRYVASIWNKYVQNRRSIAAHPHDRGPIKIDGTPYDGKVFYFVRDVPPPGVPPTVDNMLVRHERAS